MYNGDEADEGSGDIDYGLHDVGPDDGGIPPSNV